jgi:hypothetical protein
MEQPSWYADYRREAFEEMQRKIAWLDREFSLGSWSDYDHRIERNELILSDRDGVRLKAEVQVVGRAGAEGWAWSWADDAWSPNLHEDANLAQRIGLKYEIEELITPLIRSDYCEDLGWGLTAVVAKLAGALGAWRPSAGPGAPFLIIRSVHPAAQVGHSDAYAGASRDDGRNAPLS